MLVLQANDLLATHPACSEKRYHRPCRRPHERKLGDQTKDDADKEPREERSCGRSQTLLYNGARPHSQLGWKTPSESPSPSNRAGIWRCSMPTAPRQLPSLSPPNRANPTVRANSELGKSWGARSFIVV